MTVTVHLGAGTCQNCGADGAVRRMIVGCTESGAQEWPVVVAELCDPCKDIAVAKSREPGALTPPPWEPDSR
jgi:hypothetical protein